MTDKTEHIIYTKADIDQYLSGTMSHDAMHKLERAALQDPFLADAIEGFGNVDSILADKDLKDIEAKILGNAEKAKIIAIPNKKWQWQKSIAAAVVIVGIGVYALIAFNRNNEKQIASTDVSKQKDSMTNSNITRADNTQIPHKPEQVIASAKETHKPPEQKDTKGYMAVPEASLTTNATGSVSSDKLIAQSNQVNISNNNKAAGPSTTNATTYYSLSTTTTDGSKKDELAKADIAPPAKAYAEKETFAKNYDDAIDKKANTAATAVPASGNAIISLPTIKMQKDTTTVYNYSTANISSKKAKAQTVAYKPTKEDSLTVPANGWAAFNEYMRNNRSNSSLSFDTAYTPSRFVNAKTGEEVVGLEFTLDKDGKPQQIKVTQSLNPSADTTAIEMLKNGPKWRTSDKKQKGKINIKF